MKNILLKGSLLGLVLIMGQSFAGIQNGKTIPDRLDILNNLNQPVIIEGKQYAPGQTAQVTTSSQGSNILYVTDTTHKPLTVILFPQYSPSGGSISEVFSVFRYKLSDLYPMMTMGADGWPTHE